jgi:membrane protein implicated in regulation of membrane protease activity
LYCLVFSLLAICFSLQRAENKQSHIGGLQPYLLLILLWLYFLTLLELGLLAFDFLLHPLVLALGALPQMLLALIYLIYKTIDVLKQRAIQVEKERLTGQQILLSERLTHKPGTA